MADRAKGKQGVRMKIHLSYETEAEKEAFYKAMELIDKDWNLKMVKEPQKSDNKKYKHVYIQFVAKEKAHNINTCSNVHNMV